MCAMAGSTEPTDIGSLLRALGTEQDSTKIAATFDALQAHLDNPAPIEPEQLLAIAVTVLGRIERTTVASLCLPALNIIAECLTALANTAPTLLTPVRAAEQFCRACTALVEVHHTTADDETTRLAAQQPLEIIFDRLVYYAPQMETAQLADIALASARAPLYRHHQDIVTRITTHMNATVGAELLSRSDNERGYYAGHPEVWAKNQEDALAHLALIHPALGQAGYARAAYCAAAQALTHPVKQATAAEIATQFLDAMAHSETTYAQGMAQRLCTLVERGIFSGDMLRQIFTRLSARLRAIAQNSIASELFVLRTLLNAPAFPRLMSTQIRALGELLWAQRIHMPIEALAWLGALLRERTTLQLFLDERAHFANFLAEVGVIPENVDALSKAHGYSRVMCEAVQKNITTVDALFAQHDNLDYIVAQRHLFSVHVPSADRARSAKDVRAILLLAPDQATPTLAVLALKKLPALEVALMTVALAAEEPVRIADEVVHILATSGARLSTTGLAQQPYCSELQIVCSALAIIPTAQKATPNSKIFRIAQRLGRAVKMQHLANLIAQDSQSGHGSYAAYFHAHFPSLADADFDFLAGFESRMQTVVSGITQHLLYATDYIEHLAADTAPNLEDCVAYIATQDAALGDKLRYAVSMTRAATTGVAALFNSAAYYAERNPIASHLEGFAETKDNKRPVHVDLRDTRPSNLLRDHRDATAEKLNATRVGLVGQLLASGWQPGAMPTTAQMAFGLRTALDGESALPIVTRPGAQFPFRLVIDSNHRVAALITLAAADVVPRDTLENIPADEVPVTTDDIMAQAFPGEETPCVLSWYSLIHFMPEAVEMLVEEQRVTRVKGSERAGS